MLQPRGEGEKVEGEEGGEVGEGEGVAAGEGGVEEEAGGRGPALAPLGQDDDTRNKNESDFEDATQLFG